MVVATKNIAHLPGVGSLRGQLLADAFGITTHGEMLEHFPFRYQDRSMITPLSEINYGITLQCQGSLSHIKQTLKGRRKILTATLKDGSGSLLLVWFHKLSWIRRQLDPNRGYLVYGKVSKYGGKKAMIHPELTLLDTMGEQLGLQPIYATTAKLTKEGLHSKGIARLQAKLVEMYRDSLAENLPDKIIQDYKLLPRHQAMVGIHFPTDRKILAQAQRRFKFEEIFYLQLRMQSEVSQATTGQIFQSTTLLHTFYQILPFALTGAQKRVLREIYADLRSGQQMNRLLQGDVGSGKTIVAFMAMLGPIAEHSQVALVVPTEILAQQHYQTISRYGEQLSLRVALLTGSTSAKERREIKAGLGSGAINILLGTHALLEEWVHFQRLGLVIIDEQHRFGVAQRAKLSQKSDLLPHVLVMTATPIPRTLSMTLYSHLASSTLDELPPNRKKVKTYRATDADRLRIFGFIKKEIAQGQQAYIVYPRIEEDRHHGYKDLMDGYESICRAFPKVPISILHGRMSAKNKRYEMERFTKGETKIMVATTVIEVGVHVAAATIIVIENAENFGLSQLHQLRGRIGRGQKQGHCILVTQKQLGTIAHKRIETMVATSDGFKIAEADLRLRGPGHIEGLAQSGLPTFKMIDINTDQTTIREASQAVKTTLQQDPHLTQHKNVQNYLTTQKNKEVDWSQVG